MLRKAALTVLLLALASSAFASDLRVEGAKSYVFGFLAGNAEVYAASPAVRDDVLFVLRRMTYRFLRGLGRRRLRKTSRSAGSSSNLYHRNATSQLS